MLHLVTGANGFVGSHLVDELLARDQRVRCAVRRSSDLEFLELERPGLELVYADVRSPETLETALRDVDTVHHLAAVVRAPDETTYRTVNVEATLVLYRAFAQVAPPHAVFLFCSSQAAAGPSLTRIPKTESEPNTPLTPYGRSKRDAEQLLAAADGPTQIVLRPPAVYGPRDRAVLPLFRLAKRRLQVILGDPQRPFSLIHVADLARAMADVVLVSPPAEGTWFVTDGTPHSWKEFGIALGKAMGTRPLRLALPDAWVHRAAAILEPLGRWTRTRPMITREKAVDVTAGAWICSSEAAMKSWGYAPQVDLEIGLQKTVAWYREHGWL